MNAVHWDVAAFMQRFIVSISFECSYFGLGHLRYQTRSVPNHFGTKKNVFGTT